jgi:hypothetical protein
VAAVERRHGRAEASGVPDIVRVDIAALERPWKAGIFF